MITEVYDNQDIC